MKVTDGRTLAADAHVLLALQSTSQRDGLLAFSALPDAPVMPMRGPGRARRMLGWLSRRTARAVPPARASLTAARVDVTRLAR